MLESNRHPDPVKGKAPSRHQAIPINFYKNKDQGRVKAESGQTRGRVTARAAAGVTARVGTQKLPFLFPNIVELNVWNRIKAVGKT